MAEKGGLLHGSGHAVGRGKVSTELILSHLQSTEMSYRFKWTKNWGQEAKRMHKLFSHRCGLVGHVSLCFGRGGPS
jgi:hypothetical protein